MTHSAHEPGRLTRFRPSGLVHPLALLMVLALALPAALLAWPYQWIVESLAAHGGKAIVVATFFVPALGGLTGWLSWMAVVRGRCRSPAAGRLIGYLLALVALAASYYVSYRHAAAEYTDVSIAEYLEEATTTGWHVIGSGDPDLSGVMVYLIWGLEAAIVLGVSGWLGRTAARKPYCERCGQWADHELGKASIRSPGKAGVSRLRTADTVDRLLTVPPPGSDAGGELGKDQLVYTLRGCARCGTTATLTIDWRGVILNYKKQEHPLLETLQEDVSLNGAAARAAAELLGRLGGHRIAARRTSKSMAARD